MKIRVDWQIALAAGIAYCVAVSAYHVNADENEYKESHRPQFHFTYKAGWLSDINGLVYHDGEYHLFTQHCPGGPGLDYGRIGWGHAVSKDLIHWQERPPALGPDEKFGPAGSGGGGVVDRNNTSGLQTGDEPPIVLFYTGCRYIPRPEEDAVQCMAYSLDKGKTWIKYAGNPILEPQTHYTRDPKVLWHEDSKQWIMAITLSCGDGWQAGDYRFALFASPDLKEWTKIDQFDMKTGIDCPDMFELPVDGDTNNKVWVFWAGDGTHMFGKFDGNQFERIGDIQKPLIDWLHNGANGYGAQTFENMPQADGRRIQIAWQRHGQYPGMNFNQQTTFPCALRLRKTPDGLKLYRSPIEEIEQLHGQEWKWKNVVLGTGEDPLTGVTGDTFDFRTELQANADVGNVTFRIRGHELRFDPALKRLHFMGQSIPAGNPDRTLQLQILVDRTSVEIFADHGRTSMTFYIAPNKESKPWALGVDTGEVTLKTLTVWRVKSIWKQSK